MKQLLILGAGGMGKEFVWIASQCKGYKTEFEIKGFLDYPSPDWDNTKYPPILGIEDEYEIQPNDVFACSIGDIALRKKVCEKIIYKGGNFISLINNTANLPNDLVLGKGCYIGTRASVGLNTVIGDFCFIQDNAVIGHDVTMGNYVRLDCNTVLIGGVTVENEVTVHTSAVINHNVKIGSNATVGALSFVIRNVKPGTTVFGNPAKKI